MRHRQHLPTVALLVGFVVDIVLFKTINLSYAQLILATHLSIVALCILVLALPSEAKGQSLFSWAQGWLPLLQQYSTGNLLSAFLVLYSGSGSLSQSWPFFALLGIAVVGNEVFARERSRLAFHTSLLFFNLLLFFALALPLMTGTISVLAFILAIVAGTVVFQIFRWSLRLIARDTYQANRPVINRGALFVLVSLTVLYFTNLIPPLPLTLKDVGYFHGVSRVGDTYVVADEVRPWYDRFFDLGGTTVRLSPGESLYVYSAVFAPAHLDTEIVHRWEYFNEGSSAWESHNVVRMSIEGGRDGGWRTYSLVRDPAEGRWRVSVETTRGAVIGHAYATVTQPAKTVQLVEVVKK